MKKGLLILLALLVVSSVFAFTKGTINPGGSVSFSSYKSFSDDEAMTTIAFMPQLGYFVVDNVAVDLLLNYTSMSYDEESGSTLGFGVGGRYFYSILPGKLYGGLGLLYNSDAYDDGVFDASVSSTFLNLKAGYLFPIAENVFIDFGAKYDMGFGSYGGDGSGDNEQSQLGINAGLQIFLTK